MNQLWMLLDFRRNLFRDEDFMDDPLFPTSASINSDLYHSDTMQRQ